MAQETSSGKSLPFQSKIRTALVFIRIDPMLVLCAYSVSIFQGLRLGSSKLGKKLKLDTEKSDCPLLVQPTLELHEVLFIHKYL